jgi:translocation and assembly module TamA
MQKYLLNLVCFCLLICSTAGYAQGAKLNFNIKGIQDPALTNVETRLNILKNKAGANLTEAEIQTIYKEGPREIQAALLPFGYIAPTIQSQSIHLLNRWIITYTITPGPQIKLTKVNISIRGAGQNNPHLKSVLMNLNLKPGQAFNAQTYTDTKTQLVNTALALGYLDAKFSVHQVRINRDLQQADIELVLDTGPQYYFGPVSFNKTVFKDSFLHRYVPFKTGDIYNPAKLLELQQRLNTGGYFAEIQVKPEQNKSVDQQVPIAVNLAMKKKIQYTMGVGYGTDTGPRGTLGLNLRWLNTAGQNLKFLATGSMIENSLAAKYSIPGKDPLNQQYYLSALVGQEIPPNNSQGYLEKLSAGYTTLLQGWTQNISLNALHENYKINGSPFYAANLLYPEITLSKNNYDDLLFPLEGGGVNFDLLGTSQYTGSSASFLQTELKGQYIYSLTAANRFVLRGDLGYVDINNLNNLPLSLQFYAGGANSIRGFQYQGLGPGRELAVGSVEYQREVYKKFYGTVFVDAGNAANHVFSCTAADTATGTNCGIKITPGVGVMWASPVGPLELTFAQDIHQTGTWYKNIQISFSMGANL